MCFRSTLVDPNVQKCALAWRLSIQMLKNVFSLNACQSKCVFYVLKRALARRLSIHLRFPYDQMCSRSMRVDPNAYPMCPDAFSLDACLSKRVSDTLKCALARRLPIQMLENECGKLTSDELGRPPKWTGTDLTTKCNSC